MKGKILTTKKCLLARLYMLSMLLCGILLFETQAVHDTAKAAEAKVKASLSDTTVKVGNTVKVKSKQKGLTYKSSDTAIAYVNDKGVITGKKEGAVTITVKKACGRLLAAVRKAAVLPVPADR